MWKVCFHILLRIYFLASNGRHHWNSIYLRRGCEISSAFERRMRSIERILRVHGVIVVTPPPAPAPVSWIGSPLPRSQRKESLREMV
jgi:hypothetical protein